MAECKRKRWSREETLLFLSCYAARRNEFLHSRKKKLAFANVLEDMVSLGFSDLSVTTVTLENKLRTLLQAYKCAKDNARQTGAAACTVPFMLELDEIFGRQPIVSNTHSLNLGGGPTTHLAEGSRSKSDQPEEEPKTPLLFVEYLTENEKERSDSTTTPSPRQASSPQQNLFIDQSSMEMVGPSTSVINSRKRKSAKEKYYEAKLNLKKEFYDGLKEMVKKRLENQEEVEKQKLVLLAKAIEKKTSE